jgi:hypothetical protein
MVWSTRWIISNEAQRIRSPERGDPGINKSRWSRLDRKLRIPLFGLSQSTLYSEFQVEAGPQGGFVISCELPGSVSANASKGNFMADRKGHS